MPSHTVNMAVMVETTKERNDMMTLAVLLWDLPCVCRRGEKMERLRRVDLFEVVTNTGCKGQERELIT